MLRLRILRKSRIERVLSQQLMATTQLSNFSGRQKKRSAAIARSFGVLMTPLALCNRSLTSEKLGASPYLIQASSRGFSGD
jgi:hypothetical protein